MNFLDTIKAYKRHEVAAKMQSVPRRVLESMPRFREKTFSLVNALRGKHLALIAEIKKRQNLNGVVPNVFDPVSMALEYVRAGVTAICVPTDGKFALGNLEFIEAIRPHAPVPILQRDYIIDSYQLYEAKARGADAVLLMAAALEPGKMKEIVAEAESLQLGSVVEIHAEDELDLLDLSTIQIIITNNRDFYTFETDVYTSVRLKKRIPDDKVVIAEGGITTTDEIDLLLSHGIHAFLVSDQSRNTDRPAMQLSDLISRVSTERRES